jgi:hypothetical protein
LIVLNEEETETREILIDNKGSWNGQRKRKSRRRVFISYCRGCCCWFVVCDLTKHRLTPIDQTNDSRRPQRPNRRERHELKNLD